MNNYIKILLVLVLSALPTLHCFWSPPSTSIVNFNGYSTTRSILLRLQVFSSNRVRDCAVRNKQNLLNLINSPERWSFKGKQRLDELLEQLSASSPVQSPATSKMLYGRWIKQGSFRREVQEIYSTSMIEKKSVSGLFEAISIYDLVPIDDDSFVKIPIVTKTSFLRLLNFKTPTPLSTPTTVNFIYQDSDMQIVVNGNFPNVDHPQIFLKEGSDMIGALGHMDSGFTFFGKMLCHIACSPVRWITTLISKKELVASSVGTSRQPATIGGLIDMDWETSASQLPHENLLHKAQQSIVGREVVIGDLIGRGRYRHG